MKLPQTLYRGLYGRIAKKLEVDASYVSRVARGERHSVKIETALREEVAEITRNLPPLWRGPQAIPARRKGKRLRNYVAKYSSSLRQDFISHSQNDESLRSVQISSRDRLAPIDQLLDECLKLMVFTPKVMRTKPTRAAFQHGTLRRQAGFRATDLVEEYNLIRRCVFALADKHFAEMETRMLFHDVSQMDEVLDLQLQNALAAFLDNRN